MGMSAVLTAGDDDDALVYLEESRGAFHGALDTVADLLQHRGLGRSSLHGRGHGHTRSACTPQNTLGSERSSPGDRTRHAENGRTSFFATRKPRSFRRRTWDW